MSESKCQLLSTDGTPIPLTGINIIATLVGLCGHVTIKQIFTNESDSPIESSFTFSLFGTTICNFTADFSGHHLESTIKPRDRAFAHYDDAVSSGSTAFLAEQTQEIEGSVTVSIGNLPPHEACTISIEYTQSLCSESGMTRFSIPFTSSLPTTCETSIQVSSTPSNSKIIGISSNSHPSGTSAVSGDGKSATYEMKSTKGFEGIPFTLEIQEETPFEPSLVIETDPEKQDVAFMITFTPSIPRSVSATIPEFIFVID